MANVAVTNTFTAGTTISSSQVNTNYTDITTWLNNRNGGSDTWGYMKVSATVGNPVDITSTASTTELSIDNTATDGDPEITFKLSSAQKFVLGVDDSDSDFLKLATTAITTNIAFQIPTTGAQVQFNAGSVGTPSVSFIGDADTGIYNAGANQIGFVTAGVLALTIDSNGDTLIPATNLLYLDGGGDTYIQESSANNVRIVAGNTISLNISSSSVSVPAQDLSIAATKIFYFDGGGDTYLQESSANTLRAVVGNTAALQIDTSSTAGQTRILIYDVDNATLERVTVGAADSGGAGFKVLRIPN